MYENTYEKIVKAQSGDEEAMASLVKNNLGLVYNIAKRFSGRGYELEDLNQIGALGLIKSIKNSIRVLMYNFLHIQFHS